MSEDDITENSTVSTGVLVQELNDTMADLMVPAVVYIVILMVTGTIGNLMVCYYYAFKTKVTTNSSFIVVLAIYDLIVCLICMPTEIVDIELYYTFTNGAACKILRLLNYFAGIGSILTLVAIAVDRFRRIRKPTQKQMTLKMAKIVSLIIASVAIFLSWPSAVLYGSIGVGIPNDLGRNLTGFDCTSTKDRVFRPYVWAFNAVHFVMFVVCSIILIVLYSIVGASVLKHRKKMSRYSQTSTKTSSKTLSSDTQSKQSNKTKRDSKEACNNSDSNENQNNPRASREREKLDINEKNEARGSTTPSIDPEAIKVTLVMITITTLFILSFLPYLSLTVWRVKEGKHEAQFLSDAGLVGFKIGSRSFLLNSAFNPWIYGIFNSKFRQYFVNIICCKKASI